MSESADRPSNPFATRFTRPGAIAFQFPAGQSPEQLVEQLRQHAWRGQIIGPHGSGKSTLLAGLSPALTAAGRQVVLVRLRDGQRRLPPELNPRTWQASTQAIIDGYEQLGLLSRFRLRRWQAKRGFGLLVTAHASAGLPTLWQTEPTEQRLAAIVAQLLQRPQLAPEELALVEKTFELHQGDQREALFALFDVFERGQWPQAPGAADSTK
jgi:ABC-type molybdenum transport system ATPase subunit/photorepair protein PhrA